MIHHHQLMSHLHHQHREVCAWLGIMSQAGPGPQPVTALMSIRSSHWLNWWKLISLNVFLSKCLNYETISFAKWESLNATLALLYLHSPAAGTYLLCHCPNQVLNSSAVGDRFCSVQPVLSKPRPWQKVRGGFKHFQVIYISIHQNVHFYFTIRILTPESSADTLFSL